MRLIDADALIEKMQRVVDRYSTSPFMAVSEVIKWINAEVDRDHAPIRISHPTNGEEEDDAVL